MKRYLIGFITGAIIFGGIGVYAGTIQAKDVTYKNTTVDKVLDTLYEKADTLTCSFDEYTGDTTITPSTTQQTLQTNGKLLSSNITINALPLYNGNATVTPSTTSQTLSTKDKFLNSDITIGAIPSTYKNLTIETDVNANNLLNGVKAYNKDGTLITGNVSADCVSGTFEHDAKTQLNIDFGINPTQFYLYYTLPSKGLRYIIYDENNEISFMYYGDGTKVNDVSGTLINNIFSYEPGLNSGAYNDEYTIYYMACK